MNRNTKALMEKAESHTVYPAAGLRKFVVESGSSGELYRVVGDVTYTCTCTWAKHNHGTECSHILAVRIALAEMTATLLRNL